MSKTINLSVGYYEVPLAIDAGVITDPNGWSSAARALFKRVHTESGLSFGRPFDKVTDSSSSPDICIVYVPKGRSPDTWSHHPSVTHLLTTTSFVFFDVSDEAELPVPNKLSPWCAVRCDSVATPRQMEDVFALHGPDLVDRLTRGTTLTRAVDTMQNYVAQMQEAGERDGIINRLTYPFRLKAEMPISTMHVFASERLIKKKDLDAMLDRGKLGLPEKFDIKSYRGNINEDRRGFAAEQANAPASSLVVEVVDHQELSSTDYAESVRESIAPAAAAQTDRRSVFLVLVASDDVTADQVTQLTQVCLAEFGTMWTMLTVSEFHKEAVWRSLWLTVINRYSLGHFMQSFESVSAAKFREVTTEAAGAIQASGLTADQMAGLLTAS